MIKALLQRQKKLTVFLIILLIFTTLALSGFIVSSNHHLEAQLPPAEGPGALPDTGAGEEEDSAPSEVNVIRNGTFEAEWDSLDGVAPEWEPYSNGQAAFGWYDEQWPEAVYEGEHAQLMEIYQVAPNVLDRVIAIHQTVEVAPNTTYDLMLQALMRSQAPAADRNKNEFEMHWGVDFSGEGNYDLIEEWNLMPLEEQFRLGSTGEFPEDIPLFYETITGTVETGTSNKITLFIRGLKKFPTGTEVNFDVDNVSLIGPPPGAQPTPTPTPETPASPTPEASDELPPTGAVLPENLSGGVLILSSFVFLALGVSAAAGLLRYKR